MGYNLTPADYPVWASGANVYARTMSTAIAVAINDWMAADIANRLNREFYATQGTMPRPEEGTYVGGGLIAYRT